MLKNLFSKVEKAKYLFIPPTVQPNATLQAGIFHQNMGEIKPLKFANQQVNIQVNSTVDTSYLAETNKGKMYIPNTKDFYVGEGMY